MIRGRWWTALAAAVLVLGCGGTPAPPSSSGGETQNVGKVEFLSSQGQPAQEVQDMNTKVLAGFNGSVDFNSQPTASQEIDKILSEQKAGKSSIDVTAQLHSDMITLQANDALEDLTPLLQKLQKDRQFPDALVNYGKFGTNKQYYIPWLQATYMMVVNKKALPYLPKGADVNNLTYDQLIAWGDNIQKAKGEKLIGLPVAPGVRGGLMNRFLQGYAYPSFTGTTVAGFKSPEAVSMWETLRRLWAVTNPQSTTYAYMQEPLQSGEVWVAWDHQARFQTALQQMGDQFQVVPAPSGPKGLGYMSVAVGLAIPKGAPNKAGAEALIDYLTRSKQQITAGSTISFFPVVKGVSLTGSDVPPFLAAESRVATMYTGNKKSVVALVPVGLGTKSDQFTLTYQDTFTRIILRNEDIRTVLSTEAAQLQQIINDAKAPCWPPDQPSTGPCQIK